MKIQISGKCTRVDSEKASMVDRKTGERKEWHVHNMSLLMDDGEAVKIRIYGADTQESVPVQQGRVLVKLSHADARLDEYGAALCDILSQPAGK